MERKTTVVGPDQMPDSWESRAIKTYEWVARRDRLLNEVQSQLLRGLKQPGKGLTLDQIQLLIEHRNPFAKTILPNVWFDFLYRNADEPLSIRKLQGWRRSSKPEAVTGLVKCKAKLVELPPSDYRDWVHEAAKLGCKLLPPEAIYAFTHSFPHHNGRRVFFAGNPYWKNDLGEFAMVCLRPQTDGGWDPDLVCLTHGAYWNRFSSEDGFLWAVGKEFSPVA